MSVVNRVIFLEIVMKDKGIEIKEELSVITVVNLVILLETVETIIKVVEEDSEEVDLIGVDLEAEEEVWEEVEEVKRDAIIVASLVTSPEIAIIAKKIQKNAINAVNLVI